jgi:hypothetical protein
VNSIYCSSKSGVFADEVEFVNSVGFAVENVTRTAVKNGGFGLAEVKGSSVYALAQCWKTVSSDGCRECLEKAGKAVRGCVPHPNLSLSLSRKVS